MCSPPDPSRAFSRALPRLFFLRVGLFERLRSGSATVAGGGAAADAMVCSRTSNSSDGATRSSLTFNRRRATSPLSHCPVRIHDTRVDLCSPSRASTRHAPPPSSTRHARSVAGSNPERLSSGGGDGGGGGDEGFPGATSSREGRRVTSSAKPMPRSASNARVHDASTPRLTPTPRTTAARRGTETSAGASGSREEASGRRDAAAAARTSNTPSSEETRGGEGARVEPGRRARRQPRGRWSTDVEKLLRAPPGGRQADETRVGNAMPSSRLKDKDRARSGLSARRETVRVVVATDDGEADDADHATTTRQRSSTTADDDDFSSSSPTKLAAPVQIEPRASLPSHPTASDMVAVAKIVARSAVPGDAALVEPFVDRCARGRRRHDPNSLVASVSPIWSRPNDSRHAPDDSRDAPDDSRDPPAPSSPSAGARTCTADSTSSHSSRPPRWRWSPSTPRATTSWWASSPSPTISPPRTA